MKNYTAVILTPRNAIVEVSVIAKTIGIAAGLANTLFRGTVLTIVED